jgi:hypothetical protein
VIYSYRKNGEIRWIVCVLGDSEFEFRVNKLNIERMVWEEMVFGLEQETFTDEELNVHEVTKQTTVSEVIKKHRFSALVDGVCMGIGFVFLILGIAMPMMISTQMVVGLLLIIGAILCLATGAIFEVYQWAKLD